MRQVNIIGVSGFKINMKYKWTFLHLSDLIVHESLVHFRIV